MIGVLSIAPQFKMNHRGYHGTASFDKETEIFHGEVTGLRDVVTFQGLSADELKTAFQDSVDDYLEFCAEGKETITLSQSRDAEIEAGDVMQISHTELMQRLKR